VTKLDKWLVQSILKLDATIHQAIECLNVTGIKIVLISDDAGVLRGTVSDGDIRRALLKGMQMHEPIINVMTRDPLVAFADTGIDTVKQLMVANKVHQIPVVDEKRRIVDLFLWDKLEAPLSRKNLMVIMAGGQGKRLLPFTESCPKPLLQVAGKPILEHIINRAKLNGFRQFVLSIHYLGHMIEDYFGDGSHLGVDIQYVRENIPLGTAGALSLIQPVPETAIVVTNGDVLTDINYAEVIAFHNRHRAAATMAVRAHDWQHPFGVVQLDGVKIVGFEEKPLVRTYINAGVYVLEPASLNYLVSDERCDMPNLFERLQQQHLVAVAYPMHEPWMDIGRPDDLITANAQKR
jgi:dTDP-glucose pyrophosphorylase